MRILGIDPGSSATGFGVVERQSSQLVHVSHGVIRPPSGAALPLRLDHLYRALTEIVERYTPDSSAVEEVFVAVSPRSALVLGHARGAILAALAAAGVPVNEYAPTRIKRSVTGNGRATKQQVKVMVKRLLALDRMPASDAADALAAAISHANAGRLEAVAAEVGLASRRAPSKRARAVGFSARRSR
jgi:crossover junction endodeoxyribonuclease RuvC